MPSASTLQAGDTLTLTIKQAQHVEAGDTMLVGDKLLVVARTEDATHVEPIVDMSQTPPFRLEEVITKHFFMEGDGPEVPPGCLRYETLVFTLADSQLGDISPEDFS